MGFRSAAGTYPTIWPKILMDVGDLLTLVRHVEVSLAPGAIRLLGKGRAGMPLVNEFRVEIAVGGPLPELPLVEPPVQGLLLYLTNLERMNGIMVTQ